MFTKDEMVEEVITKMDEVVDEILVIDFNSRDEIFNKNLELSERKKFQIIRLFDLGYIEIYREYAFKKMKSQYVINLDPDEIPSDGLINNIRQLGNFDVAFIPRGNEEIGYIEYIPRIFKKEAILWRGYIHERPIMKDREPLEIFLKKEYFIYHKAYRDTWKTEKGREERYTTIECTTRPPIIQSFLEIYNMDFPDFLNKLAGKIFGNRPLNSKLLIAGMLAYLLKEKISNPERYIFSREYYKYVKNNIKEFKKYEKNMQQMIINIYLEALKEGGLIKYLNLDDERYVESLHQSPYLKNGTDGLWKLLTYRFNEGKPYMV